ncbi:MAG: hypothetical protein GC134_04840 [Proteobacteria bacterium]|nr:hypothetical protein [Pseudomonadota bacterium]
MIDEVAGAEPRGGAQGADHDDGLDQAAEERAALLGGCVGLGGGGGVGLGGVDGLGVGGVLGLRGLGGAVRHDDVLLVGGGRLDRGSATTVAACLVAIGFTHQKNRSFIAGSGRKVQGKGRETTDVYACTGAELTPTITTIQGFFCCICAQFT